MVSLESIPVGARIVVRTADGIDSFTGRTQFRDFVGHVLETQSDVLVLQRDAAANGSRPSQIVRIEISKIVRLKPIPPRANAGNDAQ